MKISTISQRLTKKQKQQALQEVRAHEQTDNHTPAEEQDYTYNWQCLVDDHYCRLKTALKHVADIHLLDMLQGDTIDSDYRMKDYLSGYDELSIELILREIREAKAALEWLQGVVEAEQKERHKNVITFDAKKKAKTPVNHH